MLTKASVTAMTGVNQKIVAKGLLIPISVLCITSCVNAQRRPPRAEAEKTMMMPGIETVVALKTMRNTPKVMNPITHTRRREYASSLNRNANPRTKIKEEDLHIADHRHQDRVNLQTIPLGNWCHSLYRVRVIVFKLKFDNPMSIPVATAVGIIPFLQREAQVGFSIANHAKNSKQGSMSDLQIIFLPWCLLWLESVTPYFSNNSCKRELHDHVDTGDK